MLKMGDLVAVAPEAGSHLPGGCNAIVSGSMAETYNNPRGKDLYCLLLLNERGEGVQVKSWYPVFRLRLLKTKNPRLLKQLEAWLSKKEKKS
jgi:hypothetical protein